MKGYKKPLNTLKNVWQHNYRQKITLPANRLAGPGLLLLLLLLTGYALSILPLKIAFLATGGFTVILVGIIQPKWLLYLLILVIPFSSLIKINLAGAGIGAMEGLLGLMLAGWLAQMVAQRKINIPHPPMLWPFLLFLGAIALSWLNIFSVTAGLTETLKWLEMLALYLFICANFKTTEIPRLVIVLLIAGALQAGLGIYQFVFKVGPEGFLLFGGRFLRAYGTFQQPNPYAGYLGLVVPLALSLTLWALAGLTHPTLPPIHPGRLPGNQTPLRLLWPGIAGSALLITGAGLLAAQSRGAMLGLAGAAVLTILLTGGRWAAAASMALIGGAILIAMGALALLPATLTQRFADIIPYVGLTDVSTVAVTNANFAAIERLAHWQAAATMWRDHLWLGVGIGNYAAIYPAYAVGRWLDPLGHAHNYLLNIGAETGLTGVAAYFTFWGWIIILSLRTLRLTPANSLYRAVVIGGLGIFAHLHIHNLFDNLYVQGMYLHLTVIFGLITLVVTKVGTGFKQESHN